MLKYTEDTDMSDLANKSGRLSDSIVCELEPDVKLTNYIALNDDVTSSKQPNLQNLSIDGNLKSLAARKNPKSSNGATGVNNAQQAAAVTCQEHFLIIWKHLSFQVDFSLYDRFISRLDMTLNITISPQKSQPQISSDELCADSRKPSNAHKTTRTTTKKTIFENLNGLVKSGQISAILGPSGAGKTSLLNALCGKVDNYRGTVQLVGGGSRRMRMSIIPQKDYLMENLTVKETLLYSSQILNTSDEFDHETNILSVVRMLNLTDCLESSVSNISGGEYKRVSIAQELLKQPDLLILDEPTSGLDSLNCSNLIESLTRLIDASRRGHIKPIAIVMTIHQPDNEVFHMFDHIYCMARRGRVIYDGHPADVMKVLNDQLRGLSKYEEAICGQSATVNPATLLIRIASENIYGQEVIDKLATYQKAKFELEMNELGRNVKISAKELHEQLIAMLNTKQSSGNNVPVLKYAQEDISLKRRSEQLVADKRLSVKKENQGKFWYHTKVLARRAFKSTIRDSLMTVVSIMFHLLIPFVMYVVYSGRIGSVKACPIVQRDLDMVSIISDETFQRVSQMWEDMSVSLDSTIMLFMTIFSFSLCSVTVASLTFPLNMHVLLKEVRNGWYNLPSFVIAKTIANFPFEVLFPVMSQMIAFILIGMPPSNYQWRFWAMALVMALTSVISHTIGLIFGAIFMDSIETAIFSAASSTLPLLMLSGFILQTKYMPLLLQYLSFLSPYKYSSHASNIIRFGFGICPCDDSTVDYLKTWEPNLLDIPQNIRSLFTYYWSIMPQPSETVPETTESMYDMAVDTLNTNVLNSTLDDIITTLGIGSELTISRDSHNELLSKIQANEIDPFKSMANIVVKSFSFGREVTNCENLRSEVLMYLDSPPDHYLPFIFLGMVVLLIVFKVLLVMIVRYRIGTRI